MGLKKRILIATFAPLRYEIGGGQMAIYLADSLRELGHEVFLWTCATISSKSKNFLKNSLVFKKELDSFIEAYGPFDLIEVFPAFVTVKIKKAADVLVVREVGPEILYAWSRFIEFSRKGILNFIKSPYRFLRFLISAFESVRGWLLADYIFCLGSLEYRWIKKWVPLLSKKRIIYFAQPSKADQDALKQLRAKRRKLDKEGIRFLWIGRWSYHKGIDRLINFITRRSRAHPEDTFTIAGCGEKAIKDLPQALLSSGQLKVVPFFKHEEIGGFLSEHDVGIFTSKVEGWGISLNEMLESGLTVFATEAGGVPDLRPYFKGSLRPFSEANDVSYSDLNIEQINEEYYKNFNWSVLAKIYDVLPLKRIKKNTEPR